MNAPQVTGDGGAAKPPGKKLPMSRWWPLLAGAAVGVVMRGVVFSGAPGKAFAAMMGAFIYLVPLLVGAVTVYLAEKSERRTWGYYAWSGFLANVLFVVGTLLIMIEGWVCAILIVPLFGVVGLVGALIMGLVCRLTKWPRPTIYGFAVLPAILGFGETAVPLPDHIATVERTVLVHAPAESVWQSLHNTRNIAPGEAGAWVYWIGAPSPRAGVTQEADGALIRRVTLQKGVHFEQRMIEWQEGRLARWTYQFSEDSFPAGSLDEHVVIGGHYFDMLEGAFVLAPRGAATELTMSIRYRVSTQFNWYAVPLSRLLVGNLEATVLDYYRTHFEVAIP